MDMIKKLDCLLFKSKKPINLLKFILLIMVINIAGCQTNNPNKIALNANMYKELHTTHDFIITSYVRSKNQIDPDKPLFIYIEGDGKAWISKYRLSKNPTPDDPLTLKLAAIDPNPNIIYIARPCQFTPLNLDHNCSSKYWSQARYSKQVVDSINEVIDNFKSSIFTENLSKQDIHLVGYSGGATIAGLIASQRNDVKSLRTIAGNLDHDAVSNWHQTTKLEESLNLINFTKNISHIPQMHYIGENDQIIPVYIIKNFVTNVNEHNHRHCAHYKIFKNLDHYHGWVDGWKQLVEQIPICSLEK